MSLASSLTDSHKERLGRLTALVLSLAKIKDVFKQAPPGHALLVLAYLLACLLACLLAYLLAYLPACLLACLP